MKERRYTGTCDWKQLVGFSIEVIGIGLNNFGALQKDVLAIPISPRRNSHMVCDSTSARIKPDHESVVQATRTGFYHNARVHKVRWVSKRHNELIVKRRGDNEFALLLVERAEGCCRFRDLLRISRVTLTLQG